MKCIYEDMPCKCNTSCQDDCEECYCVNCPVKQKPPHY